MSEEDLGTYQMLWDCPACDTPKLLGLDHRYCPNCGSAQDPKRRYFPEDGEGILVQDHVFTGKDLICPACDTPNAAQAKHCASCGSGLDEAKEVDVRQDQQAADGEAFDTDSSKAAKQDFRDQKTAAKGGPTEPVIEENSSKKGLFIGIAVVTAILIAVVLYLSWTKEVFVEATGRTWARIINIEEYKAVRESAWKENVPVKAYRVTCSQEKRGTKKVQDGETCTTKRKDQGNGTFKKVKECKPKYKSVPTYDDRCRFLIDKWTKVREVKSTQQDSPEPVWPRYKLVREGQCLGCERAGAKKEVYKVNFVLPDQKEESCGFAQAKWATMDRGSKWKAEIRMIGGGLVCDSLQPL